MITRGKEPFQLCDELLRGCKWVFLWLAQVTAQRAQLCEMRRPPLHQNGGPQPVALGDRYLGRLLSAGAP